MAVFSISASGLRVAFARQDVRANNIANSVTPGYKASRVDQVDVRPGGGTAVGAIQLMLRQGPLELMDGSPFALAVNGEGFFEVQTAQGTRYTRVGSFGLDANQQVVMPGNGAVVKDVNGNPITLGLGGNGPAQATSAVQFGGNLNGAGAAAMNGSLLETNVFIDNTTATPANGSTLLSNLSRMPETPGPATDLNLANGQTLTFRVNGQNYTFNVGTSLTPGANGFGTTLGELAGFMERSLGLQGGFSAVRESGGVPLQPPATALLDTNANGLIDRVVVGQDLVAAGAKIGDQIVFRSGGATGVTGTIGSIIGTMMPMDTIVLATEIPAGGVQPVVGDQFSIHEPPRVQVGNGTTLPNQFGNGSQDGRLRLAGSAGSVNDLTRVELLGPTGTLTQFLTRRSADGESVLTTSTVFDSVGTARTVQTAMVLEAKGSTGNQWRAFGLSRDSATSLGLSRGVGTGTLTFDTAGRLTNQNVSYNVQLPNAGVATPLTLSPDFAGVSGLASPSQMFTREQSGNPTGTLNGFSIGGNGTIAGAFSNGTTQNLSQLRLVRFANPGGLIQVGDNLWAAGPNSGPPIAGVAGQGGFGEVIFGALEGSNVDLGEELVGQIVNKAFAGANLAAIRAQNEMLGTLLDTVR